MAYSNWGAFVKKVMEYSIWGAVVFCNGIRREDKEDSVLFEGMHDYSHGVMGDGAIRVECFKGYPPEIFEQDSDGIHKIEYADEDADMFEYDVHFEYKDYKFDFKSGDVRKATMTEPDGTIWECTYGYCYGAGRE